MDPPLNSLYNSIIPLCPHLYHLIPNLAPVLSDFIYVLPQIHLAPPASWALSCLFSVVPQLCYCCLIP